MSYSKARTGKIGSSTHNDIPDERYRKTENDSSNVQPELLAHCLRRYPLTFHRESVFDDYPRLRYISLEHAS